MRRTGHVQEVIEALADMMLARGIPERFCFVNGLEFAAREVRKELGSPGMGTLRIEPGRLWENSYCETFNGKLRAQYLNGEISCSLKEARMETEQWRAKYNTQRPNPALGDGLPVLAARSPLLAPKPLPQPQAVM
ncbi:MAG: hypothetical protein EPN47_11365 [Acidobacteria bacterium]|nr:MAG: hypothetical protein EPN47_11365 [Acidobacteriota bacterium]